MTPAEFIDKWHGNSLGERQGAQPHFIDLCDLLGVEKPTDPDNYCFERGAGRTGGGNGWADVWKSGCFAWEYKGPGKDLRAALKQLMTYALALDNPPLLVVSDREIIQIHTHFTGTPSESHTILIQDIGQQDNLRKLRWLFEDPEKFKPAKTVGQITEDAARRFAQIAQGFQERGDDPHQLSHFLIQCLFCLFAEDVGLLPDRLLERLIEKRRNDPGKLAETLQELFESMRDGGGFGIEDIKWFNGGLFKEIVVPRLAGSDIEALWAASKMDWSQIEPSIFGTLFERGLDPKKRAQLGANFTDPQTIMRLVRPTVVEPLEREWASIRDNLDVLMGKYQKGGRGSKVAFSDAQAAFHGFLERIKAYRVLDPACGSGNFLYLALKALKDLEHRANLEAESVGLHRQIEIGTSPANVLGIELSDYAAELARVTVWIGEIQWMLKHGYPVLHDPILRPLDHIECRDALITADGHEADWPECSAIVGNPPFLGDKRMRGELGAEYTERLRNLYSGRVPGGADLVTYWFEKARAKIEAGKCQVAGLVATNSIRGGANRRVLDRITQSTRIFEAWSDEDWINDGAAVRVSLLCFGNRDGARLDGNPVSGINADLTHADLDLTKAKKLPENRDCCFYATVKAGKFDTDGVTARSWIHLPNPHGKPNSDVVKPWANAMEVTHRSSDKWVVDFGVDMSLTEAALYEAPFNHVLRKVKPARDKTRRDKYRNVWWLFAEPIPGMRLALKKLRRYAATPALAKHRLFVWMPIQMVPDHALMVVARDDDEAFGILHSRFHELWALRMGTSLEDRPRYTPTTTFETFPFPEGLTPNLPPQNYTNPHGKMIAEAAKRLNELRENWLNPPEWIERVPEIVPAFPDRVLARRGHENELKKRTLTNLYNLRPTWLANAHAELDKAVAMAYGWEDYTPEMPNDEVLRRLLAINCTRESRR